MSLTCSFRDLADQVKNHLIGGRRRASSSHDCHTSCHFQPAGSGIPFTTDKHVVSTIMSNGTNRGSEGDFSTCDPRCQCHEKSNCSISLMSFDEEPTGSSERVLEANSVCDSRFVVPRRLHHRKEPDTSFAKHSLSQVNSTCEATRLEAQPGEPRCVKQLEIRTTTGPKSNIKPKDLSNNMNEDIPRKAQRTNNTSTLILSLKAPQSLNVQTHQPTTVASVSSTKLFQTSQLLNVGSIEQLETSKHSTFSTVPNLSLHQSEVHSSSFGGTNMHIYVNHIQQPTISQHKTIDRVCKAPADFLEEEAIQRRMTMSYSGLTTLSENDVVEDNITTSQEILRSNIPRRKSRTRSNLTQQCSPDVRSVARLQSTLEEQKISSLINTPRAHMSCQVSTNTKQTRLIRPQPTRPSMLIDQESNEVAPPVLPTRTTSLLSHKEHVLVYAPVQSITNSRQQKVNESEGKCRQRRSPSDQSNIERNMYTDGRNNQSNKNETSLHSRSQSDVILTRMRCYVNTSDNILALSSTSAKPQEHTSRLTKDDKRGHQVDQTLPSELSNRLTTEQGRISKPSSQNSLIPSRCQEPNICAENIALTLPNAKCTSSSPSNVPNSSSCGILAQAMPINHASRLLGRMSDKLRDGRLADVILLAGSVNACNTKQLEPLESTYNAQFDLCANGQTTVLPKLRIPAHRVILAAASDYFAAMFGNEVKEASETEIWIHNVEPHALHTLVNYIYTGHLDLQEDTVEDILEAACFLQIVEASQACERYLIKRLDSSNCLGMSRLGDQQGCYLLRRKATKYALEHFTEVAQQPDFLSLTFDELSDLVKSDHLRVPNEATVFAACLRWIRTSSQRVNGNVTSNSPNSILSQLLKFVRLQQLPARLLTEVIDKEPLFHRDMEATRMLISALRYHLSPNSSSKNQVHLNYAENELQRNVMQPEIQTDTEESILMVLSQNGVSDEQLAPEINILKVGSTSSISRQMILFRQNPRPSTIGRLWALGGKTMVTTRALQEILEYDPYWDSWRSVGQLPGQRQQCGCIVLHDGRLLVVGGRDELKTLSTVECIYTDELIQQAETALYRTSKDDRGSSNLIRRSQNRAGGGTGNTELDSTLTRSLTDASTECGSQKGSNQSTDCSVEPQSGWNIVSAMATHRHGLGVAVLEGVVYAVGGHDGWSYLNTVERWNGKAKAWSSVTPMAVQRSTVGVAALDGLLYAVGGRDGSACLRTVERFNPHTQHWCFIAPMLHRRGGVGVGAVGGRLYAVGGHNAPPSQPHATRTASVEMYEPQTDMWTEVACLTSPRDSIAVTTLGMKLYALGGHDGQVYTNQVQVYDPDTNQWSDIAPLPSGRAGVAVASRSTWSFRNERNSKLPYYKADPLA